MVAGASHIDAALFVIAADEGISVQTREHFDILQLLGVRAGIVALTKSDLVDEARLAELAGEVRGFVRGLVPRRRAHPSRLFRDRGGPRRTSGRP